jgi:CBS domain-containing protein
MQVRDGMSEVSVTVGPSHTLRQAAKAMVDRNVGAALVIDDERDLLLSVGVGEDPDVETVGGHMTGSVLAAAPDWSLEHAAAEMSRRSVRHLVVFEEGDVIGILSMRDIVRVWTSDGATSEMPLPT